jgi:hypothetical protein
MEIGWFCEGKMVLEGREREIGFLVLRERKRGKRDLGVGRPWETVGRRKERKLDLIVCDRVYAFICKMLMWHYRIGGCKIVILIEFKLKREEFTLPMVTLEGKGKINEGILCGSVRCHVGHLFFFKLFIFSNLLGLGTEEQGVATWFIGPRTINMTSCTK